MLDDPVKKRLLKADIVTGFFAFDPLVAEDFLALREELFVEQRFADEF